MIRVDNQRGSSSIRPRLQGRSAALAALALLVAFPVAADEIDLAVGSDTLRLGYVRTLGETGLELDFSYLNDDVVDIGAVGLHVVDVAVGSSDWRVGLGGKLFYFDTALDDASAVGLGGHVRYRWPGSAATDITGSVYWAPDAASFQEAEEFLEANLQLAYNVIERGALYIGVRSIRVDFEMFPSQTIDSAYFGFRISY